MFLQRNLLWLLALLSGVAFLWPRLGLAWDPFVATKPVLNYLIGLTMFFVGWMLPRDEVAEIGTRWPAVAGGTAIQYLAMPALAFLAAWLWRLEGAQRIGVILVGVVPGAMASNVLTLNARGHASYSVSLTTLSTMLSPLMVPFALLLLLGPLLADDSSIGSKALEPWGVFQLLALTVVLPVVAGHLLRRVRPDWGQWGDRIGPVAANATILWIIAVVVGLNRQRLGAAGPELLLPLLFVNLLGYAAGHFGARAMALPEPMRRALVLEVGMQNAGLGSLLAIDLFGDAAAVAPALYTFGCMLTGTLLARLWARE